MKQTSNYGLKKPEGQDVVNIDDLNYNADILDTQIKSLNNNLDNQVKNLSNSKVDKVQGKQLSTEDYSTGEKQKLAGIAQGANNYVHPNDSSTRHVTDSEKSYWNSKSDGSHSHDDRYYTEAEVNNALSSKANNGHTHDDRYYTEEEIDNNFVKQIRRLSDGYDLDTVVTSGFYRLYTQNISTKSGTANVSHSQMIVSRGGDTITQIIATYDTNEMFVRCGNGTTVGGNGNFATWERLAKLSEITDLQNQINTMKNSIWIA